MQKITVKERFKIINGLARKYRWSEKPGCPPSLPFVAWCGHIGIDPNFFRCQLSLVTKAKETAWSDLIKERYYDGWLQDKWETHQYNLASGHNTSRRK